MRGPDFDVLGVCAVGEGPLDQPVHAVADHAFHLGHGIGRAPVLLQQFVQRLGDVGGAVHERTVEIEEHGAGPSGTVRHQRGHQRTLPRQAACAASRIAPMLPA